MPDGADKWLLMLESHLRQKKNDLDATNHGLDGKSRLLLLEDGRLLMVCMLTSLCWAMVCHACPRVGIAGDNDDAPPCDFEFAAMEAVLATLCTLVMNDLSVSASLALMVVNTGLIPQVRGLTISIVISCTNRTLSLK